MASVPDVVGGPEAEVAGTYLTINGEMKGHMLLMFPIRAACAFASMLMGEPPEDKLSEMARSALGEAGNITGSFFLAALSDSTGMELSPSPPAVVVDMGGAILDVVLADLAKESEEVFVIDTVFEHSDKQVNAVFLVLPRQHYLDTILEKLPK
jgi:chemotaxis protein CheC